MLIRGSHRLLLLLLFFKFNLLRLAAAAAAPPLANSTSTAPSSSNAAPPPLSSPPTLTTPPPQKLAPSPAASVTAPPPSTATPPSPTAASPSSPPIPSAAAPAPAKATTPPPALAPAPGSDGEALELEPSQIAALEALKVNFSKTHPCTATPPEVLLCSENATSKRHLIALTLSDCPSTVSLTTKPLANLSTLNVLEVDRCPFLKPVTVPSALADSLNTFICTASLGRTSANQKAAKLSGTWLSKLSRLQTLHVSDVQLDLGDGLFTVTQNLDSLTELTLARGSYAGVLPRNTWPSYIRYIDVSGNSIRGTLPSQMGTLTQLEHLDLSSNQIRGLLPDIFDSLPHLQHLDLHGNLLAGPLPVSLAQLRNLSHIDLSNNRLNGSIPANLSRIATLRYLDLSNNQLTGPIPFNASFLSRLTARLSFDNNPGLCYNHSSSSLRAIKALADIPDCAPASDELFFFAPAPAPSAALTAGSERSRRLSAAASVGIASATIVVAAAFLFLGFRWWKSRQQPDRFVDMASSQHKL